MSFLNFSKNITNMRHQKGITQEELAAFIGVTKASVSKWETGQSLPDIVLLPELAVFFDVTVDELLGYEPWLSKEQIKKKYHELAEEFANQPFEEVMEKCERLVKKYYSCYPFLLQICILWLNHFMLAKEQPRQLEILEHIAGLCEHIQKNCRDIGVCNDAVMIKAMVDLQCGKAQEVIETLEEILNPYRLDGQGDGMLTQAYMMTGDSEKADSFNQITIFNHLLAMVSNAIQYLVIHAQELEKCETLINRIDKVLEVFALEQLHQNIAAGYYYQTAIVYSIHGKNEQALERLEKFISLSLELIKNAVLHGDDFFCKLDEWFEKLDLGAKGVRDGKLVLDSVRQALEQPVFLPLMENSKFQKMKKGLEEKL